MRRLVATTVATAAVFVFSVASSWAAESAWPTAQAVAAHAEWVPYLDPPEKPAAVCLVDSGVNVTPDTPADSPDGPIVKRLALDGGTGEAAGPEWEQEHGTRMAMVGGAPMNDWGTVGMWPGVRIVSVRAMPMGATTFPFDVYERAILTCKKWAHAYSLAAVNLSLGCQCAPSETERTALQNRIGEAHLQGLNVVASAGNGGGVIGSPAREPGIFSIAATDVDGATCASSNRGAGLGLLGPGCGMDLADPSTGLPWSSYDGATSAASMTVSTTIALLRSYQPSLSWEDAEASLRGSARPGSDGPVLDVEAAFRSVGLGPLVDEAHAKAAAYGTGQTGVAVPINAGAPRPDRNSAGAQSPPHAGSRTEPVALRNSDEVARPRTAWARWTKRGLKIGVSNRPRHALLVITVQAVRAEFGFRTVREAHTKRRVVLLRLRQRPTRIGLRFELAHHDARSPTVYLRLA